MLILFARIFFYAQRVSICVTLCECVCACAISQTVRHEQLSSVIEPTMILHFPQRPWSQWLCAVCDSPQIMQGWAIHSVFIKEAKCIGALTWQMVSYQLSTDPRLTCCQLMTSTGTHLVDRAAPAMGIHKERSRIKTRYINPHSREIRVSNISTWK